MIPRLVVASKNPDKITEIEHVIEPLGIAGEIVRGLDWPDIEETGATLEDNALLKARAVAAEVGLPSVADDTGLEVMALGGRPGSTQPALRDRGRATPTTSFSCSGKWKE